MSNRTLTILSVVALLISTPVQAASFNEAQKEEIGTVVRDYLIEHPEVITQAITALQDKEMKAWAQKAKDNIKSNFADFFNSSSPTNGVSAPKITVLEYFDYNCPHCRTMHKTLSEIVNQNKEIQVVYKELPVLSEASVFAAKAALAAREQSKYLELHQKLMDQKDMLSPDKVLALANEVGLDIDKLKKDMDSSKVNDELLANRKTAMLIGLKGTPTFVIGKAPATKEMAIEIVAGEVKKEAFEDKIKSVK